MRTTAAVSTRGRSRVDRRAGVGWVALSFGCNLSTYGVSDGGSVGVGTSVATTELASTAGVTEVAGDTSSSSGVTGGDSTTGALVDTGITLRIDAMKFVDPHLFLLDTTDPNMPACTADITELVNGMMSDDIAAGDFNLLVRFEDFADVAEVRLIHADCEESAMPGGPPVCTPSESMAALVLGLEAVETAKCREIDPAVYAATNVPMVNDPMTPCMRTKRASFSLPFGGLFGVLELREAQFVASLDDEAAPTRLIDGVLHGFLTKVSAENLVFEVPLFGTTTMWALIDTPGCQTQFPDLLPSVDTLQIGDTPTPGVWLAINFTAERVLYQKPL